MNERIENKESKVREKKNPFAQHERSTLSDTEGCSAQLNVCSENTTYHSSSRRCNIRCVQSAAISTRSKTERTIAIFSFRMNGTA